MSSNKNDEIDPVCDPCCPDIDFEADCDWSNAFNLRTLEQNEKVNSQMENGARASLKEARNTIEQTEQYLAMIYELLSASLDQVYKVQHPDIGADSIEGASVKIIEYLTELDNIAKGAQYNGVRLFKANMNDNVSDLNFTFSNGRASCSNSPDTSTNDFIHKICEVGASALGLAGPVGQVGTDGTVSTTDFVTNDHTTVSYTYTKADGTTEVRFPSLIADGIRYWDVDASDDDDHHDNTVTLFNCAIKKVGLCLDKMRAYRYVLCLREKQINIWKKGLERSHKMKRNS